LFGVIHLLGRSETGTASTEEEALLRLFTTVIKAFAADKACAGMEECMAALGGQGYMEENIIPRRDSFLLINMSSC
jgi:alkylation response protein AidB-like acyl-CoA dehydrogenase